MTEKYNGFTNHITWNYEMWLSNGEGIQSLVLEQAKELDKEAFAGWLMYNAQNIMGNDYDAVNAHTIDIMSLVAMYREIVEENEHFEETEEERRQDNKANLKMYVREVSQHLTAIYTVIYDEDHDNIKALIRAIEYPYGEAVKQCKNALFIVNGGVY